MHQSHIPYVTIDATMNVYDTIMAVLDDARKGVANDLVDFAEIDTIILDSVFKTSDLLMDELCEMAGITGKPQFEQWGELLNRMTKIIDGFVASDYNFIATSGESYRQDEMDEDETNVTFNFSGSYRNRLPYAFDFNLYMVAKKKGLATQYLAYTQEENKRTAKSRVQMPRQILDPSYSQLREFVEAGLKRKD